MSKSKYYLNGKWFSFTVTNKVLLFETDVVVILICSRRNQLFLSLKLKGVLTKSGQMDISNLISRLIWII